MRNALAILALICVVSLGVAACAQPSPTPSPTPKPTATPTPTPTATAKPTATPTPTASPAPTTTPAPTGQLPKVIGWATYSSGSSGYVLFAGMGNAITKATGTQVRIIPSGSVKSFFLPTIRGETLLTGTTYAGLYCALNGTYDWWEEGPQSVSIIWNGEPSYQTIFVRADSDVYSIKDLKGKRFPDFKKLSPSWQDPLVEGMLAFVGLTSADVRPIDCADYVASIRYCIEGSTDAGVGSPKTAIAVEMASSVHGARTFDFPAVDKEGWQRVNAIVPYNFPWVTTTGATASKDKPREWMAYAYPVECMTNADEYTIYRITKAIIEGYDIYKDVNPAAPLWTAKMAVDPSMFKSVLTRYHPGAIRAFKEANLWSPEMEKLQQQAIKFDTMRFDLWNKAREDGLKQNILVGTDKWKDYWLGIWKTFVKEAPWRQ